jgi:hypothetical protein
MGHIHVADRLRSCSVLEEGLEPPQAYAHQILSLACLPVPPLELSLCASRAVSSDGDFEAYRPSCHCESSDNDMLPMDS